MLVSLGKTDDGLRELYTGIQFDPNDADGHYNLGVVLATLGACPSILQLRGSKQNRTGT
jgi:hypothetical protein